MRIIYERIEDTAYLEVVLTQKEIDLIPTKGAMKEFDGHLFGKPIFNLFIRKENQKEEYAS